MSDFIKSDYCTECDGTGEIKEYHDSKTHYESFQCESCEELHRAEIRADRMQDEMKGN